MNVKQIICLAKMFVIISRLALLPPEKCATNLHDNRKFNMAADREQFPLSIYL